MTEPMPDSKRTVYTALAVLVAIAALIWLVRWVAYIFGGRYIT